MKQIMFVLLNVIALNVFAEPIPVVAFDVDRAKTIAVMHAKKLNLNEDILAVVREGMAPSYLVMKADHVSGAGYYQIWIRRTSIMEECPQTQSIVVEDTEGGLMGHSPIECEGN